MADRSNLPAPYESPWRQLGQALRAVTASLGLDLRALWRRNRAGELPRPSWWPLELAPLLWPLVLALVLALAGGLGAVMRQRPPQSPAIAGPEPAAELTPIPAAEKPEPALKALEQTAVAQPGTGSGTRSGPRPEPVPIPEPDPVLEALSQGPDSGAEMIRHAQEDPAHGALILELNPAFDDLDPRRQRRLAERWLERSLELGFDQLALIDAQGEPLGYRARIGSGMILLNPEASS